MTPLGNGLGNPLGNSLGRLAAQAIGVTNLRAHAVRPVIAPRFATVSERNIADEAMPRESRDPGVARGWTSSPLPASRSTAPTSKTGAAESNGVIATSDALPRASTPMLDPSLRVPAHLATEQVGAGTEPAFDPASRASFRRAGSLPPADRAPTLPPRSLVPPQARDRRNSSERLGRSLDASAAPAAPNISIEVSIGRIELRVPPSAPAIPRVPAARLPSITLDNYLAAREGHRQ